MAGNFSPRPPPEGLTMKKFMVFSLAALVAGAAALPAQADDPRLRGVAAAVAASSDDGREWRGERRDNRGERRDGRHDRWDDRRDDRREVRHDRRDDRRDWRGDRRDDRRDWRQDNRNDRRDWRPDHRDNRRYARHDDRRWRGNHWRPEYRYRAPARYVYPPGHRAYRWHVGHRLPSAYYGRPHYYVDYRHYHLPPPPYGHRWVRVDKDVILVAIATGLVLDVLYDLYY
ncbi:hypothetical protein C6N40_07855 [Arenimonas caeni]|uniref:RcnB family protein n=2 Tax=Arenimonas caeni TaxID=2058085 RepID=A0A2P6M8U6_9GAMM|nr:hypothetical protein C6N40_07855 [Arenimonas caeni]